MSNLISKILENQKQEQEKIAKQRTEWGIFQRNKLVKTLESNGVNITNHMYDMLLFNINGLRINEEGKICYLSFYKPSKRILELLARYNKIIVENFNYITKGV
jgi:hypothetical protein